MSFNVSEEKEWMLQYRNIWNEVESQLFEKLATEPIKGMYVCGKLKTWKVSIKTNFHGQDIPYDMCCNTTAVLKIDSVYKQGKNHHLQTYVEECKYTDAEKKNNAACSVMTMIIGFLRYKKEEGQKIFVTLGCKNYKINEQDVSVRTCKKVKHTSSKLCENKGRT